jgi:hypothetical protein
LIKVYAKMIMWHQFITIVVGNKGASSKGRGNKGDSDEESEDNDSDFDDEPKKKVKSAKSRQ